MPFEPQPTSAFAQTLLAQFVATSKVTDTTEGAVGNTVLRLAARQFALVHQRIKKLYDAFGFSGQGSDLDDRVAMLPGFEPRQKATQASGSVMQFTRTSAIDAITVPAGIIVANADDPDREYITTGSFPMGVGELVYPPSTSQEHVSITCLTTGTEGNADIGQVSVVRSATHEQIVAAVNTAPITTGTDRESDEDLRKRALDYIASLCQTTPRALEYLARAFIASDGTRSLHAFVREDPLNPAYAELILDDGDGFPNATRDGQLVSGVVPENGQREIWIEGPAASTPTYTIGGVDYSPGDTVTWTTVHERGRVYFDPDSTVLVPGVAWSASNYRVYKLRLVIELQEIVEGLLTLLNRSVGWRAAGCRIRVVTPSREPVDFAGRLVVRNGYDFDSVAARVKATIIAFLRGLVPGDTLIRSQLHAAVMAVDGVYDFEFTAPGGNRPPTGDAVKLYTTNERCDLQAGG